MSLLNDALRAAEQRQNRPEGVAAYTGQPGVQPARPWRLPVAVLAIAAVAAGGYMLLDREQNVPSGVMEASPVVVPPAQERVASDEAKANVAPTPRPEQEAMVVSDQVVSSESPAQARPSPEQEPEIEVARVKPPVPARREVAAADEASLSNVNKPETDETKTRESAVASQDSEAAQTTVKQVRETPEAIDRRVSRELERLLRAGDSRQAEQKLVELASGQAAPVSREVFARAMLLQQQPDRALRWLSDSEVSAYPALRLLRARALLTTGDLSGAVGSLREQVPPVPSHIEYRVTLATLLQQAGDSEEAARHWTALISVDDSRAAWWVGLAIALESRGELASAARAYGQAAQLPGLSPSLADYVRERLETLQAG
ncbi:tetratricopeptide repeat protein [Marinobacter sp. F4216]|uniref:tetratricopeptide repeat protein n=1 Tax=Marinobacter sp. F4216 TaxID=2874281 RepID=UPI001CBEE234|nr:tetratricopeptide repeat protein [Marinobacter sp. F4216]MBZ2170201.1 hypothetical protein [Marinobacter sp. F4216]